MRAILPALFGALFLLVCSAAGFGQAATGFPPFSSFGGSSFDTVNNANLNVHFAIPIVRKAGRGLPFYYLMGHDSSVWVPVASGGTSVWAPVTNWGWSGITQANVGYITYFSYQDTCYDQFLHQWVPYDIYDDWTYVDPQGTEHATGGEAVSDAQSVTNCDPSGEPPYSTVAPTTDGSGYSLSVDAGPDATANSPSGIQLNAPLQLPTGSGSVTDTNGNTISTNGATFTDTLGTTALTVSGSNPVTYSYQNPSSLGGSSQVTMNYSTYTVQTNFGCYGISEFGPTSENLVSSIGLPDGTSYQITYEPTPGYSGNVTGRIASVTLPTGGTIHYSYSGGNNGINCSDGSTATLTRTTPDGAWTYSHSENGNAWTTTVTDPQGNQTAYNFQGIYETERRIYQGSGTLLETVDTCYNGSASPCTGTAVSLPITQRAVTVTIPGVSSAKTVTSYNTYGLPTETDVYDYGPNLVRKTLISYASLTNIYDRPASVQVYNGSGGLVAQSSYAYDTHGNLLTLTETTQGSSTLSRSFTYGTGGVLATATDFAGHQTSFTYGDCSNSFPTSIAQPLSLTSSLAWDCNGGVVTSVTDPNNQTTSFSYDEMWRPTATHNPDGGQASTAYNDTANPVNLVMTTKLNASQNRTDTTVLDALGRVTKTQLNSDPAGVDTVNTAYDSLGRVASVTNPYRGSPSGSTAYAYDALGRVISVTYADGNTATTSYLDNCSTATDPAGKKRETCADALGRVIKVIEDPGGLNYETDYGYDALGNLVSVNDGGQTRSYTYDMLSRLISATTPESGTTNYSYTASGGASCSGDPANVCTRTDARGVTTTYRYDTLNRLTSKSYSDGTPVANFWYDSSYAAFGNWNVSGMTNTKGRLFANCTSNAVRTCPGGYTGTVYSYDPMGRITSYWQATPYNEGSSAWQMAYSYDLAGDLTSWTHPAGFTITNTINTAQQITQIKSSLVDSTHPQYLAQNITYTPWGAEQTLENGCAGSGCTNTVETYAYNNRLQPVMIELGTPSNASADYCLVYNYYASLGSPGSCAMPVQGTSDNGNVMGYLYQDNVNPSLNHSAAYSYDSLNRLTNAVAAGNSTYNLAFIYDRWGNMTCTINQNTQGYCPQYNFSGANNRITNTGYTYDAAGNLTTGGSYTYQWDGEGRLVSVNNSPTASWSYNALGDRTGLTAPWATADVLFTPDGQLLSYWNRSLSDWGFERFWLDGRMMAYYNPDAGTVRLEHVNGLSSASMVTDQTGALVTDQLFYPWGGLWQGANTEDPTFASLLGDDRTEDLYPGKSREYTSSAGRWLSPDPLGGDISNPQSLNRYAYALNNPTTLTDPTGLTPKLLAPVISAIEGLGFDGGGDGGGCALNGIDTPCGIVFSVVGAGAAVACPGNECGPVEVSNNSGQVAFAEFHPTQTNPSGYQQLTPWISDPSLPQNEAYGLFSTAANQQNLDPSKPYTVNAYYQGVEMNIAVGDVSLDTGLLPFGSVQDPFTFTHGGNTSYFQLWSPFNSSHYVDMGNAFGFHQDVFGPLVPLHYLDWGVGVVLGPSSPMTFTCQMNMGCH